MPFRMRLRNFNRWLIDGIHSALSSGRSHRRSVSTSLGPEPHTPALPINGIGSGPPTSPVVTDSTHTPLDTTSGASNSSPASPNSGTWKCLRGFLQVLDSSPETLGHLKMVMENVTQFFRMHEDTVMARRDYEALRLQLESLFGDLTAHFSGSAPPMMTASIYSLCNAINNELGHMPSGCNSKWPGRRHLRAMEDLDKIMECYRRIHGHLERLTLNADLSAWKIVDELTTEARLKSILPAMSACYNSAEAALVRRRECTPRTREHVLTDLNNWGHDQELGGMYWLNGMAGTGKTTIANSLCAILDQAGELGASFFCSRLLPQCRDVKLILPTLAYQLARFSHPFRCELSRTLERDPDVHTRALPNQFEALIVNPLKRVAHTLPAALVVAIDALDECDDSDGVEYMLEMLAKRASELPIKIFVSSRPEPQIRTKLGTLGYQMILHELDNTIVKQDIRTYLQAELESLSLSDSELSTLVERAGVLFIYAATVVRYIAAEGFSLDPRERLAVVLGLSSSTFSNKNKEIDALYGAVLDSAFNNPNLELSNKLQMRLVLETVICSREPLVVEALAELLQLKPPNKVHTALRPLWSVLHISSTFGLVTTLHQSFSDYMLDAERSKEHKCEAKSRHGRLAELCFKRIKSNLRQFNICALESSFQLDEQVPDLEERARQAISPGLAYACQYWAIHLKLGGYSSTRLRLLDEFLRQRLLIWMEVLNLKKRMNMGALLLETAKQWCSFVGCTQDMKDLVYDAWRFVTMFASNRVSRSTPHIYVSMLASWPASRPLTNYYLNQTSNLVRITGTGTIRRQLALLSSHVIGSCVKSVTFSPDGTRIASGSDDNTICIWDTQTRQMLLEPLEGHTDWVLSVAFSPDGTRIASSSSDQTILVWDAQNGKAVLGPLRGHNHWVNSVGFSFDGTHIVSGSHDGKTCVWDASDGRIVLGPLERPPGPVHSVGFSSNGITMASGSGNNLVYLWDTQSGDLMRAFPGHTAPVYSVAYSSNGSRIVSGSRDTTIRVWDAQAGQMLQGPLRGHAGPVYSVAFAPNGLYAASGSEDNSVFLWNIHSGQMILGPLDGHTAAVNSVALSPDGTFIASGSDDQTICVWDAQSRGSVTRPLDGHTSSIYSVTFSSDSSYIASCAYDHTVRVWDVRNQDVALLVGTFRGHSGSVNAVAFSPDGNSIVSCSQDRTIYVWDIQNRRGVLGPLHGHFMSVTSVVYSPDGTSIVSGSDDHSIIIWDSQSGEKLQGPLKGHTGGVNSVSISPNGLCVASGSYDSTICVWDTTSGDMILGPLQGHTDWVHSVAYSPCGSYIASGSHDHTVCVWDAYGGSMLLGPLIGHTDSVYSVTFSPDSKWIFSGSWDNTICTWDVLNGQMMREALKGHTSSINSVCCSPDGTRIVSGSEDKVIRVWQNKYFAPGVATNASSHTLPRPVVDSATSSECYLTPDASAGEIDNWRVDEHGWVVDKHGNILLWVPPDMRNCLLWPQNTLLISTQGSIQLDFEDSKIGTLWTECYKPA